MSIELRLSSVDPPAPEPARTIYGDLVNLPDPIKLGLSCRIFNYDSVTLYFKLAAACSGWTFAEQTEGSLASGSNMWKHHDQWGSRAKPASETTEIITLTLRAYTDAGYSILKWTFTKDVTVMIVKSNDGSWTTDYSWNFDDGTVQTWAATGELNSTGVALVAATDFVLSAAYSLRLYFSCSVLDAASARTRISKTINTPNRANVFLILNLRARKEYPASTSSFKAVIVRNGSTEVFQVGLSGDTQANVNLLPITRWIRLVAKLPSNVAGMDLQIAIEFRDAAAEYSTWFFNFDDMLIISKD